MTGILEELVIGGLEPGQDVILFSICAALLRHTLYRLLVGHADLV